MKKQVIFIKADLQYFRDDEKSRREFVDNLTKAIKEEILSPEPVGILVYDKSHVESIELMEVDTPNISTV